ncbi:MAG: hypothetical protein WBC74_02110 [Candidatus Omnitrophota bacterium]
MKKVLLFTLAFVLVTAAVWAGSNMQSTPKVRYRHPKSEAIVDLSEKENLTFKWKSSPSPGGGRSAFRFELYKGFSYDVVLRENLEPTVLKLEVPAETFKPGQLYSWQVKQRSEKTRDWSADNRWTFEVIRK